MRLRDPGHRVVDGGASNSFGKNGGGNESVLDGGSQQTLQMPDDARSRPDEHGRRFIVGWSFRKKCFATFVRGQCAENRFVDS